MRRAQLVNLKEPQEFVYVPLTRSSTDIRGVPERVHGEMLEGGIEWLGMAVEVAEAHDILCRVQTECVLCCYGPSQLPEYWLNCPRNVIRPLKGPRGHWRGVNSMGRDKGCRQIEWLQQLRTRVVRTTGPEETALTCCAQCAAT